jgi:peptide/nickel transport system substrate-binding protein
MIGAYRIVALLTAVLMVACAGPAQSTTGSASQPGAAPPAQVATAPLKPLVAAVGTEPSTLDAQAVIDRNSRIASSGIFESLLDRDTNEKLVPWLAESYSPVDESSWRFTLRRGVTFHNGEPFNAEAAAYSVNRILDKDYKTQRTSYTEAIKSASVVDEYTVDVLTDGLNAVLPVQMTQLVMVPPKASAERDFGQKPVGTGPYKFVSWDRGREIKLVANDQYWGAKPTIREFITRVIPDAQTQISALQVGEVDIVLDLLPEQASLAPRAASVPSVDFSYIQFNAHKTEMSDPRVRVAMNLAVDKETLAKTIYQNHAKVMDAQHLSQGMLGYNPNIKPYPYDPARARQLLRDAGYANGFAVTLNAPIGRYLKAEETVEYVAAQLNEVGIRAKVELMEWNAYRDAGRIAGDKPGAFDLKYGWNSNEWFDASRIVAHITCKGTSSKLCNTQIDDLMDRAIKTLDQGARDQMYQQVWGILNQDPHAIYLLQQNQIFGISNRVQWQPRVDDEFRVADMKLTS